MNLTALQILDALKTQDSNYTFAIRPRNLVPVLERYKKNHPENTYIDDIIKEIAEKTQKTSTNTKAEVYQYFALKMSSENTGIKMYSDDFWTLLSLTKNSNNTVCDWDICNNTLSSISESQVVKFLKQNKAPGLFKSFTEYLSKRGNNPEFEYQLLWFSLLKNEKKNKLLLRGKDIFDFVKNFYAYSNRERTYLAHAYHAFGTEDAIERLKKLNRTGDAKINELTTILLNDLGIDINARPMSLLVDETEMYTKHIIEKYIDREYLSTKKIFKVTELNTLDNILNNYFKNNLNKMCCDCEIENTVRWNAKANKELNVRKIKVETSYANDKEKIEKFFKDTFNMLDNDFFLKQVKSLFKDDEPVYKIEEDFNLLINTFVNKQNLEDTLIKEENKESVVTRKNKI